MGCESEVAGWFITTIRCGEPIKVNFECSRSNCRIKFNASRCGFPSEIALLKAFIIINIAGWRAVTESTFDLDVGSLKATEKRSSEPDGIP